MSRQYYILTQAQIMDPFTPAPIEGDICQCLPEGGVWRYQAGAWTLYVALPVVGVPLAALPVQLNTIVVFSLVNTNPATLLGFGTWASIGDGKVKIGIKDIDLWAWKRTA